MDHGAKKSLSRNLVWVDEQKLGGWGCSSCAWVFYPSDLPSSRSLEELTAYAQRKLEEDFASHKCSEYPRRELAGT